MSDNEYIEKNGELFNLVKCSTYTPRVGDDKFQICIYSYKLKYNCPLNKDGSHFNDCDDLGNAYISSLYYPIYINKMKNKNVFTGKDNE